MGNPFDSNYDDDSPFSGQSEAPSHPHTIHSTTQPQTNQKSLHPITIFFTIFFKAIAICSYIFLNMLIGNFIITFIVIIFALAFDFWVVKNVSGRLLVGLRWWNHIGPDGMYQLHHLIDRLVIFNMYISGI